MKKKILVIILVLIILAGVGTGIFFLVKGKKKETATNHMIGLSNNPNIILDEEKVPIFVDGKNVSTIVSGKNDVYDVLDELQDLYGFDSSKDVFNIISDDRSGDFVYYKVNQKYDGIEIYGKQLVITVKDKEVINVAGHYYKDLDINTEYKLSESDIKQKIDEIEKEKQSDITYKINKLEKKIYIFEEKPNLVYVADVVDTGSFDRLFLSGATGEIINTIDLLQSARYEYTGPGINGGDEKIVINKGITDYTFKDPDRNITIEDGNGLGMTFCKDGKFKIIPYLMLGLTTAVHNPISATMSDNELVYSLNTDFNRGLVSTMANFEKAYDYYYKKLGRKSFDGKGSEIYILYNVGDTFLGFDDQDNASWLSGNFGYFQIGNHEGKTLARALDIVGHEYTHAVIEYTAGFEYEGESGALNESYADIMGSIIENKNFTIGEDADFTIRDMADPNKFEQPKEKNGDYYFPADKNVYDAEFQQKVNDYFDNDCSEKKKTWLDYDHGGVHVNSGVPNHAAYLMYENGAFKDKDEMAKIWYNSLFMLTSTATFEDAALAVMATAKNFGLEDDKIEIIKKAFIETKMLEVEYTEVTGKVVDSKSDEGIANVKVIARYAENTGVSYSTYTNNDGEYKFEELTPDEYVITFTKSGYESDSKSIDVSKETTIEKVSLKKLDKEVATQAEIVFVIDISLSMEESDPNYVRKQIIANLVSSMDDSYKLAVVTFKKSASLVSDGIKDDTIKKGVIITDVYNLVNDDGYAEDSGTNGKTGLTKALKLFTENKTRKFIVFLTDGADNIGANDGLSYDEIIEKAKKKDIKIISVGLGTDLDPTTLNRLASETGGKYFQASSSTKLHQFDISIFED